MMTILASDRRRRGPQLARSLSRKCKLQATGRAGRDLSYHLCAIMPSPPSRLLQPLLLGSLMVCLVLADGGRPAAARARGGGPARSVPGPGRRGVRRLPPPAGGFGLLGRGVGRPPRAGAAGQGLR